MHFVLYSAPPSSSSSRHHDSASSCDNSFEFEFSSRFAPNSSAVESGSMSSADELFLNGQIRPMKLSSHLQRPQMLAPLSDRELEEDGESEAAMIRGRDLRLRNKSLHRKTRSMSPIRNAEFHWQDASVEREHRDHVLEKQGETTSTETTPSGSASSSRSSSYGRNSKKWIFLKDLLYRSKSEGRSNVKEKFWSSISFSKEEKSSTPENTQKKRSKLKKSVNGAGKRTNPPPSAHELHYTANRAQAEELRKKTFLPYRQGLLGCLGFSSKGYGALNGFTRTLNPLSSS